MFSKISLWILFSNRISSVVYFSQNFSKAAFSFYILSFISYLDGDPSFKSPDTFDNGLNEDAIRRNYKFAKFAEIANLTHPTLTRFVQRSVREIEQRQRMYTRFLTHTIFRNFETI